MLEYTGWDTMAVLNQRQEKIERDRQRAAADKALRDHFAAAALAGLLCNGDFSMECIPIHAFSVADAMLRERSRTGQIGSGGTDAAAKCTDRDSANLDASPEATANAESVAPQPTAGDRAGNPPSHSGTGDTPDSPKPINDCVPDRSKPINGPDPDSRVWETHTPATHATRGEGSEPREGTQEPVAWAVRYRHGDTGIVDLCRTLADCRAKWSNRTTDYWLYEPLYRQPPCQDFLRKNLTLTDAEREAVERGYCSLMGVEDMSAECSRWDAEAAAVLRGLLERTK